jgi:hypothetical protein
LHHTFANIAFFCAIQALPNPRKVARGRLPFAPKERLASSLGALVHPRYTKLSILS